MQGDVSLLLLVHAVDACALAFVYFKTLVSFFFFFSPALAPN